MSKVAAIIPAKNEAATIDPIIATLKLVPEISEIIVVDSLSTDETAKIAKAAGARVVRVNKRGKGEAMAAGVGATEADVILFFDADLLGLSREHVQKILAPVLSGRADMTIGLRDRYDDTLRTFLAFDPLWVLSGQRALRRELFTNISAKVMKGWWAEIVLNTQAKEDGWRVAYVTLSGLTQLVKEQKWGFFKGFSHRIYQIIHLLIARFVIWWIIRLKM